MSKNRYFRIVFIFAFFLIFTILDIMAAKEKSLILADNGHADAFIIVLPDAGKVAAFAATELKKYLDKVTGASFKIVNKIPIKSIAIIVGDSAETRKLGVLVKNIKRDGFILKRFENKIVIAGRDDKSYNIGRYVQKGQWRRVTQQPECATIFAVYDFLERVAGVRWYFPGQQGEFLPKKKKLAVDKLDIREEPVFKFRWAHMYAPRYKKDKRNRFHDYPKMGISHRDTALWTLRNKVSTTSPAWCHMPVVNNFHGRFGKKHPEWFALRNRKRLNRYNPKKRAAIKLCYSSPGLLDEITKDVDAYFSGKPPQTRGLKIWNPAVTSGDYFSLIPNDGLLKPCECSKCQAKLSKRTDCSELIWGYVADIAKRVKPKHPGKYVTCLSYWPYMKVPETVKLPNNVLVGITLNGPAARAGEVDKDKLKRIRLWNNIVGKKIFLWTYNAAEVNNRSLLSGIPRLELKALGLFYKAVKNDILGSFYENEIEYGFQNHLDLYIFQKVTWNPDVDVKKIIREYCHNMYGPAASEIYEIINDTENLWTQKISSPEGRLKVNEKELWTKVYSPVEMKKIYNLMNQAVNKAKNTEYISRVQLFRKRFLEPLERKRAKFAAEQKKLGKLQIKVPYFNSPITIDGKMNEPEWTEHGAKNLIVLTPVLATSGQKKTKTYIRYGWNNKYLYLMFICEDDSIDKIRTKKRRHDDGEIYRDEQIKLLFNPDNAGKDRYHIAINPSGSVMDLKYFNKRWRKINKSWNSNIKVKVGKRLPSKNNNAAWLVEMAVPFSSFGKTPELGQKWAVNFCRAKSPSQVSSWNSFLLQDRYYSQPEWFGSMIFERTNFSTKK